LTALFSKNLTLAFLVSTLSILAIVSIIPMSFETIDDFFMSAIASGFIGGNPDEHLIYTSFIIGWILKVLYLVIPSIAWYGLYLLLAHCVAWIIILFVLLEFIERKFALWIFFYLILVFEIYFLQNFQFTTSAALLSSAGMLLLFRNISMFGFKLKPLILPFAVVVFASLMRMHSAALSVILFSPIFLIFLPDLKKLFRSALVVGILFVICNLSMPLDKLYYNLSDQWGDYYNNFFEVAVFSDDINFHKAHVWNPDKPYKKFGWSDNDLAIFTAFFWDYPPIFNKTAYTNLHAAMNEVPYNYEAAVNKLLGQFRNSHLIIVLLFSLLFLRFFRLLIPATLILLIILVGLYIQIRLQLKGRVLFSIIFSVITLLLLLIFKENKEGKTKLLNFLPPSLQPYTILAFTAILSLLALNTSRNSIINGEIASKKSKERLENQLKLIANNKLTAFFGASIKFEAESPFSTRFNYQQNPKVYPISAFPRNPLLSGILNDYGAENLPELLLKEDVEIVTQADYTFGSSPEYLITFYKEHLFCDSLIADSITHEKPNLLIYRLYDCTNK